MKDERTRKSLDKAADAWDKAEGRVKQAQQLNGEVVQASINELRYAGRRLVDAFRLYSSKETLDEDDQQKLDSYIAEVELFCLRAEHDAIDAQCFFFARKIDQLESNFGQDALAIYFSDSYFNIARLRERIDELVALSREERDRRQELYDEVANEWLPILRNFFSDLMKAEAFLKDKAQKDQEDILNAKRINEKLQIESDRRFFITVGIAIAGIVIGVLS